ncbi:MAG: chromosome segregation protein SMC [Ignavibacteriales bacterium]
MNLLFLKRLEICGFKSFPEKVEMEFGRGVSVVVGPNGSGKSNIADSIRWVLGEQSARAFRGARMEDVIFAGNHKRKPLSLAEVSISIDNSDGALPLDFSEVSVTRRVSRDGEGEYFLNQSPCRLKDIADWFADTGIGRDSFSVLAQGQVDEVLTAKPEERRAIFEEVAGIVKFRNRKRDALRRLAETEDGLVRLGDIVEEIERQLGPLKEQEEKARKHLDLRKRLMTLQVGVYLDQISSARALLDDTAKKAEKYRQKMSETGLEISRLEREMGLARDGVAEAEAAIASLNERLKSCEVEAGKLAEQLSSGQERLKDIAASRETLARESASLAARLKALESEVAEKSVEATGVAAALESEYAALSEAEGVFEAATASLTRAEEDIERRKGELIDLLNDLSSKKNEASEIRLRLETAKREISRATQEKTRLENEMAALEEALRSAAKKRAEAEAARSESSSLLSEAREKMTEIEARKAEMESRMQQGRADLSGLESQIKLLEEMEACFEGYLPGPRAILEGAKRGDPSLPGVVGAVADLIRVARGYERPVEAALGEALQYVVTRSEGDALNALKRLNESRAGRATVLPVSGIRPSALAAEESEAVARSGFARTAMSLVECDPRWLPVVSHLLGRVVIVDSLDHALLLSRRTASRFKIVTMDGEVINPGGSLTGGYAGGEKSGLLGRSGEIRSLKEQASLLGVEMMGLKERTGRAIADREVLSTQVRVLEQQIWAAESEIAAADKETERAGAEKARLDERIRAMGVEIERSTGLMEDGNRRLKDLAAELERAESSESSVRAEIANLQEQLRLAREAREKAQAGVTKIRVSVAGLESARNSSQESLNRAARELEEARERGRSQAAEVARLGESERRIREAVASAKKRLEELAKERDQLQVEVAAAGKNREDLLAKVGDVERQIQGIRKRAQDLQEKVSEMDVRAARVEVEAQSLRERLQSEWGVPEEQWSSFTPLKAGDAQPAISEIKAEMDALGVVNLGAIEEYRATRERHDFLQKQIGDMQEAKKSLTEIIRDVDKKMSEVFTASFEKVRENFRRVFKDVFGGGAADLSLTEGTGPLEAGVEIKAQPPGRRVQNINLLSGGEKAMTAIALLFAILMTRPSPFCVLDEIDAALDDSNVERFGKLLRDYGNGTQFIVITHQKATMELADRLYGLTMEEPGVSKLVSVKLMEKAG